MPRNPDADVTAVDPLLLEELMDAAWRSPDYDDAGPWVLRSAGGVTQRANSLWPRRSVEDPAEELAAAAAWYRARRQPVIVQVLAHERHAALNELLDGLRFTRNSETLVMVRTVPPPVAASASSRGHAVELADRPSEEWLQLWWSVDGRGGPAERVVAERILAATPSRYATVYDHTGAAIGVGRLAVPGQTAGGTWGGVYAMAVRPDARRTGVGAAVLDALLADGAGRGVEDIFLLVMASNAGARALYETAGFREAARYHYRQAPLRRPTSSC
ncbi:GNAT family N-acetyltransferase [Arthrobacter sp. 35W]|uniref:GNAT family N-acetyltransferase n=1 Tax=Arthrobacter sp. 35W TaxID=1132441 RepID=UPI0003F7EF5C|nr:GNAT family N-acetyltransferase [Arthrobacter sp. 35W]